MKKIVSLAFYLFIFTLAFSQKKPTEHYMLVGTYTWGKSEGIYVYKFNSNTGAISFVSSVKTSNPSFLTVSPDKKFVYSVNEDDGKKSPGGSVTAFSFNKQTGTLTKVNEQSSGGDGPCHLAVDKTGKWVIAGNYGSGTLAVLPVNKNGSLDTASAVIQHEGSSVNADRQQGPHVHETVLSKDNRFLFVPDLGIDKLMIYHFDAKNGAVIPAHMPYVETQPGHGPRHIAFSPDNKYAYLLQELSGTVSAYRYNRNGELDLIQDISALPPDYTGPVGSAEIAVSPDGKFAYASNRGESNTIAIFKIDHSSGQLSIVGFQSTLGKTPRNFNFDPSGKFLIAANQDSNNIIIFKRNQQTGLLTDTGNRIDVGNPVCIEWIDTK
jgi:6-phosphogluconolactonase